MFTTKEWFLTLLFDTAYIYCRYEHKCFHNIILSANTGCPQKNQNYRNNILLEFECLGALSTKLNAKMRKILTGSQNKYYTEASLKWSNRKALFFGGHVLSKCPKERHAPPRSLYFKMAACWRSRKSIWTLFIFWILG